MSEPTRGEICGATRTAAPNDPCPVPPHGDELPHDPHGRPWRELPLFGGERRG